MILVVHDLFAFLEGNVLRNKVLVVPGLGIIIWPTVYVRDLSRPVSVDMLDWCSPFECVGFPRVLYSAFSVENAAEEIVKEHKLERAAYKGEYRDDHVDVLQVVKKRERRIVIITTRKTGHPDKVHREEYPVGTHRSHPEMYVTHILVEHAPEHFWIPVVDTGEHSVECRDTHYKVEVGYDEVGIVDVDVKR